MYYLKDVVTGQEADFDSMKDLLEAGRNWSRIFEGHHIKLYASNGSEFGVYYMGDFTSLI